MSSTMMKPKSVSPRPGVEFDKTYYKYIDQLKEQLREAKSERDQFATLHGSVMDEAKLREKSLKNAQDLLLSGYRASDVINAHLKTTNDSLNKSYEELQGDFQLQMGHLNRERVLDRCRIAELEAENLRLNSKIADLEKVIIVQNEKIEDLKKAIAHQATEIENLKKAIAQDKKIADPAAEIEKLEKGVDAQPVLPDAPVGGSKFQGVLNEMERVSGEMVRMSAEMERLKKKVDEMQLQEQDGPGA